MRHIKPTAPRRLSSALLCAAALLVVLPACAPLLIGGAMVGGGLMATDRRTSGAQIEDQSIELKAAGRARELAPDAHASVTSYNRMALITGEVASEAQRTAIEQAVTRIENVRSVVNELAVMGSSSLTARSNDVLLSAKVKATFVDAKDLQANAVKVVTERGTVYLLGRVTEREAARGAALARQVPGVQKVVRVFEILSEEELAAMLPRPAPATR